MIWPFENDTGAIAKKMAKRSFWQNKIRNSIAALAIFLTTLLMKQYKSPSRAGETSKRKWR